MTPAMQAAGRGKMVLVGSRVSVGIAGRSQYAASKAALVSLARSWAAESIASGVTVNVVSPAATDTPMLVDPARDAAFNPGVDAGGSLPSNASGLTFIDCSTGDPDCLAALAGRLQTRGIAFIEAPLSGSSAQIAAGEATLLLGGDAATIAAQTPVLDAIAQRRIHVGGAGMGARAKLATNLVPGLNRAALAEGMVFAENQGIAPATFLHLIMQTPAHSGAAEAKGQMMVNGNFAPQSRIRQHLKDVELMIESAHHNGQKLPLSETYAALMRSAIAAGDGDLDNAAIIRQIQREKQ